MGVLTPEQYALGLIPVKGARYNATNELFRYIYENLNSFHGAIKHGSSGKINDSTLASDIDLIVSFIDFSAGEKFGRFLEKLWNKYHIEIESKPQSIPSPHEESHSLIPTYRQTLEHAILSGNAICIFPERIDPIEFLNQFPKHNRSIEECAISSNELTKREILNGTQNCLPEKKYKLHKKILQSPFHVMRRTIQTHDPTYFSNPEVPDTKRGVYQRYLDITNSRENAFMDRILELKAYYNHLLRQRRDTQNWKVTEYLEFLDSVKGQAQPFLDFIEENLRFQRSLS